MAEELPNADSLDQASSQYDFLRSGTPNIEVPDYTKSEEPQSYLKSNYPALKSVDSPAYPMRDQVTGLNPFGLKNLPKDNTQDMGVSESIHAKLRREAFNNEDKNVYAKTYSYDASPQGAHMARYKAYGQETFDRIGFNPELNNEAIFNEQTTMTDDFARFFTHSAWPMLKLGFMAPLKSYHQLFSGDSSNDQREADMYQELNAIGYSTKGGLGGFTNNVLLSAAYSAGIVGEAIAEGMMMGAIEGSIVGPEGTVAGGAVGGAVGALKGIFSLPKALWQMGKYGSKMLINLKNAEKYTVAKNLFKSASTTVGDFVNPISNTKDALANNVFKNSDNLSRMARAARTFGGFYNDVKNINAALSEGSLEAGMVKNEMYKDLYDKYYAENGVAPTSDEQRQMLIQANLAGTHAKMWNVGLIFYTNKITLPNILGNRVFKGASQTVARSGSWKAIFDPKAQVYEAVKVNAKNALKGLVRPANYGKVSLAYFKTNVAEGIQENLQDVIADATKKYYTDAFKDDTKATFEYGMGAMYGGLQKQWGAQGFETFMSGFAMGAILKPLNNLPNWLTIGYNKMTKSRDEWSSYTGKQESAIKDLVNDLNNMHEAKNGPDFLNLRAWNYGAQGSIAKVLSDENLTKKEEVDTKHASLVHSLISVTQNGYLEMFMNNYKQGYSEMEPKELEEAFGLQEGQGAAALKKIAEISDKAKVIKARHDYAMKLHAPKIRLTDYKKGTPEYQKAEIQLRAHQIGVRNLVFLQDAFDNNLERINKINNDFASLPGFKNIGSTYIQALLDPKRLNTELQMLKTEVELGGEGVEQKRAILSAFEDLQAAEKFYTVDFLAKLKDKFSKADASVDNEEILKELETFSETFRELGINPEEDYRNAFANVLKAIAGDNATFHDFISSPEAGSSVNALFESILDLGQLRGEREALVPYINTLLDPDGFANHVERNFQWMSDLYNSRKDYYKEIINKQIKNIEHNSLLADLADEGIYVDLDEFADFVESGTLPTYFIDSVNDRIINEDSLLYDEYIDKFFMVLENRDKNPAGDQSTLEEQLEERINERNEQRAKELTDARKVYEQDLLKETGKTEAELLKLQNLADDKDEENKARLQARLEELRAYKDAFANATVDQIAALAEELSSKNLIPGDLSEAAAEFIKTNLPDVQKSIADLVGIQRANNLPAGIDEAGNVVDQGLIQAGLQRALIPTLLDSAVEATEKEIELIKPKAVSATPKLEKTKAYVAYQKVVSEINDKYDKLIEEVKAEFAKKAAGTVKEKPSINTPWEELPTALKDKLTPLFDEFKTKNNITEEEEVPARQNWLQTQSEIIDEYNRQVEEGTANISVPKMLYFPNEFDGRTLSDLKLFELKALRNEAEKYINSNKKPNPENPEELIALTQDERNNLEADLNALNNYINTVRTTFRADATFESKLNLFKERILDRQSDIEEELDEDGNVVARYLDGKIAQRVTKHAEKIQSEMLGKKPFIFGSVNEQTLPDGTIKTPWTLSYFRSILDNAAMSSEQKLSAFMSEFRKKTTKGQFAEEGKLKDLEAALRKDFSEENLIRTINKLAYRESAIAGNTIDVLIRDFFTLDPETGFKKITKPANMTQEAFDALFGDKGIITEFRDGMIDGEFFLLSNNLNVFDSSLLDTGLAGAMDIVAIDKDGNFFIVDIKTSTKENWDKFDTEYLYKVKEGETIEDIAKKYKTTVEKLRELNADEQTFAPGSTIFVASDANSKKLYFRLQQSIYRNLFYNMSGEMPSKIGLLPIEISYDLTGFITSAKKASILPEGESTIELEYAPEVEEYGVTLIEPSFPTEVQSTPTTGSTKAKKADIEKELFSETDSKGRTLTFFSNTKEKDGLIKTTFTFNRSDKDPSQRNNAVQGIPVEKALGNKYTIDEEYIPEGAKVVGVSEIRVTKTSAAATVTFEVDGETFQGEVKLNSNTTYNAELAALEGASQTTYEEETPEDTSLGANIGKTVLFRGEIGKLVVSDDGVYGVEIPTEDGSKTIDLYSESLPAKNKDILATTVGVQFMSLVTEPLVNQVVEEQEYKIEYLDKPGNNVSVNGTEYRVNRNNTGQVVSLTYNSNQSKIKNIDARILELTIEERNLREEQKKAAGDVQNDYPKRLATKIANIRTEIQSLNIQRKKLSESNQQRTLRGGNMENVILALNSTPQTFSTGVSTKTGVDEIRDLKEVARLSSSEKVSQRIDEILSLNYPSALDELLTKGISGISTADRNDIIEWASNTITELENYGYTLLSMDQITTDVENQIRALNQLLNDVKLIQLTKDGRISKKQPAARQIFQPEKVQTGPSVPAVPKPVRQRKEGVPGQERGKAKPTGQEQSEIKSSIKQIISDANDESIAANLLNLKKPTPQKKSADKFIKKLEKAKTQDELLIIKADAHAQHAVDPLSIDIQAFDKAFNNKLATFNTELTTDSLKPGDYLVRKNDPSATTIYVFERLTLEGDAVLVELGATEPVDYSKLPTYSDEELVQFRRIDMEETTELPEQVTDVTKETKVASTESAQNLEDLKKQPGAFDEVKAASEKTDKKSRLKNLKNNSNLC